MKISAEKIEESLLASRGRALSFVEKPERDLSTPLGRLHFIRDVVVGTPAHAFDMRVYPLDSIDEECGCALHHARRFGLIILGGDRGGVDYDKSAAALGMGRDAFSHLFFTKTLSLNPAYIEPTGAPAKAEFLRRIDAIIAASQPKHSAAPTTT